MAASVLLRTATAKAVMAVSAASAVMGETAVAVTDVTERPTMTASECLMTMPAPMGGMVSVVGAVAPTAGTAMAEVVARTMTAVMSTARGVMVPETAM